MLTIDDVNTFSDAEAQALLRELGEQRHGTHFQTALAREVGMSRRGMSGWLERGNRPPAWILLLLSAWGAASEAEDLKAHLKAIASVI